METYKAPGVSIKEIAKLPPSIAEVSTAIPAFIGYTQKTNKADDGTIIPVRITSLLDYEALFGTAPGAPIWVGIDDTVADDGSVNRTVSTYLYDTYNNMYYHMQLYFANGGGPCYIVSVGQALGYLEKSNLLAGLEAIKYCDEPTLLVFPEATQLVNFSYSGAVYNSPEYNRLIQANNDLWNEYGHAQEALQIAQAAGIPEDIATAEIAVNIAWQELNTVWWAINTLVYADRVTAANEVYVEALKQCASLKDRFLLMDCVYTTDAGINYIEAFRMSIGTENLAYGAAYYPYLETSLNPVIDDTTIWVSHVRHDALWTDYSYKNYALSDVLSNEEAEADHISHLIRAAIAQKYITLNPAPVMAAVYAQVDTARGVWKAPANVGLNMVRDTVLALSDEDQDGMNIDPAGGKSINAIRTFTGKGTLVWGARTLAGNDNEWRYIPVRRLFSIVEENIKKATEAFVFEPNDANTWVKVQGMIDNYLTTLWRAGALQGAKPAQAFYVSVGLGKTMTPQDILEGRMNIEIGMAAVRPAEFIVLKFSHMMAQS